MGLGLSSRKWQKKDILEVVLAFKEATNSILHLCYSWFHTKSLKSNQAEKIFTEFIKKEIL